MLSISKDAFTLAHCDALIAQSARRAGTNLLPNQGFELGGFSSWSNSGWSIVASTSVTPNANGNYAVQAASASAGQVSTLESNRVAVSGNNQYVAAIAFATPDGAPNRANNLRVDVRWYNGTQIRADTLWASPVKSKKGGLRYVQMTLTSPVGATEATFFVRNVCGAAGTGTGVLVDDPFLAGVAAQAKPAALEIWEYARSGVGFRNLKFSWNHQTGCKRMTFRLTGPSEYLWMLMQTALGHYIETHYENQKLFGGVMWGLKGMIGGRAMGVSLDALANFVKVPYRDSFYIASDADSMLRYGRKDLISDKTFVNSTDAMAHADFVLSESAFPRPLSDEGDKNASDYLDVDVAGLFATLQWVTDLPPVFIGYRDTAAVAATLTSSYYGMRSVLGRVTDDTPNDFISRDYALVEATGTLIAPLENTERQASQDLLLDLIARGTSLKRGIVAGVDADRRFYMRERPTQFGYYRERDRDGQFSYYDTAGNEVPRPLVRCGEFLSDGAPLPSFEIVPGRDAANDPTGRYITEVEYAHEDNTLRATLLGSRRLDLDLARVVRSKLIKL